MQPNTMLWERFKREVMSKVPRGKRLKDMPEKERRLLMEALLSDKEKIIHGQR